MTIKEFLVDKTLEGVDIVDNYNIIISLVIDGATYGIDVDTSMIPYGQHITTYNEFLIVNDILTVFNVSLNINEVNML